MSERGAAVALSEGEITREAGRIGAATMLSRLLGLVRDMQFAALFGTTRIADAFNIAYRIPNTFRLALAEGAVRSSFVPVLSDVMTREGGAGRAREVARRTLTFWSLALTGVSLLGVLFAGPLVRLFTMGSGTAPDTLHLTTDLTRFLFPFILIAGMTALAGGILNAYHRYAIPAIAPIAFNVLSIAAAYVLCPRMPGAMNGAVWGFAIGTMAGGIAGLVIHFPTMKRLGISLIRSAGIHDPAVRQMGTLLVPAVVGLAVYQVNIVVDTVLATRLGEGAVTALSFSQRVTLVPLGVFGLAVNTAALPSLSSLAASGEHQKLRSTLGFSLRVTFAIMAPTCLGLILLAVPIVRLIFERGAFDAASTPLTAQPLIYFAAGLPAFGVVKGLAQAFYAYQDTRTPFGVGIVAMLTNVGLNLLLMGPLGVGGIALATSLSGMINMTLLAILLQKKTGRYAWRAMLSPVLRIIALSAASCGVAVLVHKALWSGRPGSGAELVPVTAAVFAAGIVYVALAAITRTREVTILWESYVGRRKARRS